MYIVCGLSFTTTYINYSNYTEFLKKPFMKYARKQDGYHYYCYYLLFIYFFSYTSVQFAFNADSIIFWVNTNNSGGESDRSILAAPPRTGNPFRHGTIASSGGSTICTLKRTLYGVDGAGGWETKGIHNVQ